MLGNENSYNVKSPKVSIDKQSVQAEELQELKKIGRYGQAECFLLRQ